MQEIFNANKVPMLDKLCNNMYKDGYEEFRIRRIRELVCELQKKDIQGIDRFIRKLSQRTSDKQDYMDIFIEGRFAVTLANNGFSQIDIECFGTGPDISANYNNQPLYFEVTRRRPEKDEWAESFDINAEKSDSPQNIISKIQDKLVQLLYGELNIVVYWSSTSKVTHPELNGAFSYIQQEISGDPKRYDRLSGILFTEMEGIDLSTLKQFYLFTNHKASKLLGPHLTSKLESLHSRPVKELQRERRDREAAYKRLYSENI